MTKEMSETEILRGVQEYLAKHYPTLHYEYIRLRWSTSKGYWLEIEEKPE